MNPTNCHNVTINTVEFHHCVVHIARNNQDAFCYKQNLKVLF